MKLTLDLRLDEVEKLLEALGAYRDEGPSNDGWCSDATVKLRMIVYGAVKEAKASAHEKTR